MARLKYRKINTRIWNDSKFRALSNPAKLVFFFLLTHPNMTPLGAIRANLPGLAFELSVGLEDFKEAFEEVLSQGMAEHDEEGMLIWFPKFLKHNAPESPNVVKSWIPAVRDLPESAMKTRLLQHAACTIDGLSQAFRQAFADAFGEECPQATANQGTGNREQGSKKSTPDGVASPPADGDGEAPPEEEPTASPVEEPESEPEAPEDSPEDVQPGPKVSPCPYGRIVEAYNQALGDKLPQVRELTEKRKRTLQTRWRANPERQSLDWWRGYFERIARSAFLTGERGKFKASFDWITNPSNMVKILEGNYDDVPDNSPGGAPQAAMQPKTVREAHLMAQDAMAKYSLEKRGDL